MHSVHQKEEPACLADTALHALLLHVHHHRNHPPEALLEPLPVPLTAQPLPLFTRSLVELLEKEILLDPVLREDRLQPHECLRDVGLHNDRTTSGGAHLWRLLLRVDLGDRHGV
jgi:hypothetical protein